MGFIISSLDGYFDGYTFQKGPITVYIEKDKIVSITKEETSGEIDGSGKIMIPPFVDGHTHLIFAGNRFFELSLKLAGKSYSEILDQGGGIKKTMKDTRETDKEDLLDMVLNRLDTMLHHGTLVVEAKSGYGLSTHHELKLLRILKEADKRHPISVIPTFGGAHVIPPNQSRTDYVNEIIEEMLPQVSNENLATSTDVFCDRGAFTKKETQQIFDISEDLGLPVRVHAEELEYRGIAKIVAENYNCLSADHLLHAKEGDFEVLKENQVTAMFMPMAPIGLFSDQRPSGFDIPDLNIGLGSDFNPNNWSLSMQTAVRMAIFTYEMTPAKALSAATLGSYKGITGDEKNKIQEGEDATFLLVNASSIEELGAKFGQNLVDSVYKKGNKLIQNSHLTN